MLLNLSNNVKFEVTEMRDEPDGEVMERFLGLGFPKKEPTKSEYKSAKQEAEKLLGFTLTELDAFMNPGTKEFWVDLAATEECDDGDFDFLDSLKD